MPRKVIFTVTNDLTYDQRMQRICTSMTSAGYQVELVGRILPTSAALDAAPYQQTRLSCLFTKGKLFYLEYNIRLFLYLLFHQADIICAIDLDTILACFYAAKLRQARIVYDAHEYFPEVPEVVRRPRIKALWQWIERNYVPRVDAVYTTTESISDTFARAYNIQVSTVRNLPLALSSKTLPAPSSPYLLYQGSLNEGRGLEHLIEAMADIDMPLWLVGEGDLSDTLRAQVKKAGLEHKVVFKGYIKPAALKELTAQAYIGINLLENKGLSYYYSLANKYLDYIQAAVPQVSIDFPEYRRINDTYHIALLVENVEKNTIKTAIERLIKDKEFYTELKENCLVCRVELTWEKEAEKLIAVYERLS